MCAVGHVGHWFFAGANTVDPIATMAVADLRQSPRVLVKRRSDGRFRVGVNAPSIDIKCALAAVENAVVEFVIGGLVNEFDAVLIDHPQATAALLWRDDFDGNCFVEIHRPLGDVEVVRAHVAESATGIFTVTPPLREVLVHVDRAEDFVKAALRSRPQPHLPVYAIRLGLRWQIAADRRGADTYFHLLDFADSAIAHALDRLPEFPAVLGALLAADLKDDVVSPGSLDRLERSTHGDGQRFFTVDILLGVRRHDGRHSVPMVGRTDDDRIHGLVVEDVPEIDGGFATVFLAVSTGDTLDGLVQPNFGHLGDGGNPAVRLAKEEIEVARVHAAKADETKVDPLAWLVRPDTGRDDVGGNDRCCSGRSNEFTT